MEASWVIILTGETCLLAVSVPKSYPGHTLSPLIHLISLCLPLTCTVPLRIIPSLFQRQVSGMDEIFSPRYNQRSQEMLFFHFTRMDLKEVLSVFWTTAPGQNSDNLLSSELCPFPFFTSIHPSTSRD